MPESEDSVGATRQCENCGEQRYEFEACMHCGHKHWRGQSW